jgi:hypothetical protein
MEHKIINCTVSEEYIISAGACIGRAGSHDETALVLEFRDIWRGLSKTLFWTNADGTNGTMQILTPDMLQGGAETYRVPVPYGAKTRAGWAKLTIRGVMVEGETETVCAVAEGEFEVMEAEMPEDYREQLDIEATAAEQIMAGIENIKGDILTAVDSAKAAEDAAQNAESYTINPPRPVDGVWEVWDGTKYVRTNEPSRGKDGGAVLTEADKAELVNAVLAALPYYDGDVTISGGVELIDFTINGTSYQALPNMTWAEWGANETYTKGDYDVLGDYYVYKSDTRQPITTNANGSGSFVNRTDVIIAGHSYGIQPAGN